MLIRLLFWAALIGLVVWWWRRKMAPPAPPAADSRALPMVRCAECGVHLPKQEALLAGAKWYCCAAHRRASHD